MTPAEKAVRYLCANQGIGFKTRELHDKFGGSRHTLGNVLLQAARDGLLRREMSGRNASIWFGARDYTEVQRKPPEFQHQALDPFGRSRMTPAAEKLTEARTWMQV